MIARNWGSGIPREWRRIAAASATLALAIELLLWFGIAAPTRHAARQLAVLAERIQLEDAALNQSAVTTGSDLETDLKGELTNIFLKQLDQAVVKSGVRVVHLEQEQKDQKIIDVELLANLDKFLKFSEEIEVLGATLDGLSIKGATLRQGQTGITDYSVRVKAPHRALLRGAYIDALTTRVSDPALRDPFEPARDDGDANASDVSSLYRLTGITHVGSDDIATINDLDYRIGSAIGPMTVTGIASDHVILIAERQKFIIRLQRKTR
jgi:hypothetical protein